MQRGGLLSNVKFILRIHQTGEETLLVGADVEQSTKNALEAIANGLTRLNDLLDYWPDYKGDDATNEKRIQMIQSAIDLVGKGSKTVKGTEEDNSVLDQV